MDKKIIDDIVWWIPFKTMRDSCREILQLTSKEERERIKEERERIKYFIPNILERSIELVTENNDINFQKMILKKNLSQIEIEISSFCNRKCWFCPNSIIDRHSNKIELPENLFIKILNDLREIDYSGNFAFHRFNEPLADRELILKRANQAREYIPKANLMIATNGDYLTKDYLDQLRKAGINGIGTSYYFNDKNEDFDLEKVKIGCDNMSRKLGLKYDIKQSDSDLFYAVFDYDGLLLVYRSQNFKKNGIDRAGLISELQTSTIRDYACHFPFGHLFIDYNGLVMPCCNMRSDVDDHSNYILGDINKNNLFEIFLSKKIIELRKYLSSNKPKIGPCKHCYHFTNDIVNNWIV